MRKLRNSCAHNERVYGISRHGRVNQPFDTYLSNPKSYTRDRTQRIIDGILYLWYFLTDDEYKDFLSDIKNEFVKLQAQLNTNAFQKVRAETGIRDILVLDELSNTTKSIDYKNFE